MHWQYAYDEMSRLTWASRLDAQGVQVAKSVFVCDAFSRKRIVKEYALNALNQLVPVSEKRYVYDGMDVIQERDGGNVTTAGYTRDGNIGGLLAKSTPASTTEAAASYYYHYDGSDNVVNLTDGTQATVAAYESTPMAIH